MAGIRWGILVAGLLAGACAAQRETSPPPRRGEAAPIHTVRPVAPPPDAGVSMPVNGASGPAATPR